MIFATHAISNDFASFFFFKTESTVSAFAQPENIQTSARLTTHKYRTLYTRICYCMVIILFYLITQLFYIFPTNIGYCHGFRSTRKIQAANPHLTHLTLQDHSIYFIIIILHLYTKQGALSRLSPNPRNPKSNSK